MSADKKRPAAPLPPHGASNVSNGPFVDHEGLPPDAVDQASHGSGRRNAEKTGSDDLAQTRGGQGNRGEIDEGKRSHRK
jgi:hypothetical protein